jgi:hypothetical protein
MNLKTPKKLLAGILPHALKREVNLITTSDMYWGQAQESTELKLHLKGQKQYMLHRKIYQLCGDGREVCVFLRDQQRWIERARIIDVEGDLVTLRYETDEEDEMCSWEEMVRLESIGAVTQKLASVPRGNVEPLVSEDCPEAERIRHRPTDSNPD